VRRWLAKHRRGWGSGQTIGGGGWGRRGEGVGAEEAAEGERSLDWVA
jgi:hypothetical protein